MNSLTADKLTELLRKLVDHSAKENAVREADGLPLKRFEICVFCETVAEEHRIPCQCWNDE